MKAAPTQRRVSVSVAYRYIGKEIESGKGALGRVLQTLNIELGIPAGPVGTSNVGIRKDSENIQSRFAVLSCRFQRI